MKKAVVIDIELNSKQALDALVKLTKQQSEYRKELSELQKKGKAGVATDEDIKRIISLKGLIAQTTEQIKRQEKELSTNADSLQAVRNRVADLNKEFNQVPIGGERFQEIQAELFELNQILITSNKSANQFKDNIGNYPESFGMGAASVRDFQDAISDLKKAQEQVNLKTKEGQRLFEEYAKRIEELQSEQTKLTEKSGKLSNSLSEAGEKFTIGGQSATGFAKGLVDAGKAALANPYILLATALAGLVSLFAKSKTGQQLLSQGTAILSATFSRLVGSVERAVLALGNFLTQPLDKILSDIWDVALSQITNRFFGLVKVVSSVGDVFKGDFKKALQQATDGFIEFQTGFKADTINKKIDEYKEFIKEVSRLDLVLQKTANANDKYEASLKKVRNAQELLLAVSQDATKTFEERIKATEQAIASEQAFRNANASVNSELRQRMEALKRLAEIKKEDKDAQTQAIQAEKDYFDALEDSQGRINGLQATLQSLRSEQTKYYQELKINDAELQTRQDEARKRVAKEPFERLEIERKIAEDSFRVQLERLNQRVALSAQEQAQINKERELLETEYNSVLADIEKERQALILRESVAGAQARVNAVGQITLDGTRDSLAAQIEAQNEFLEAQKKMTLLTSELTETERFLIEQDFDRQRLENKRKLSEFEENAEKQRLANIRKTNQLATDSTIQLFQTIGSMGEKYAVFSKIASVAGITIDSFRAITATLADPTIQPTWVRIALATITGATAALNIGKALAVQTPKSPFGGGGGSSAGSAVPAPSINNQITPAFAGINASLAGNTTQIDQRNDVANRIEQASASAPTPIVRVTDIETVMNTKNQVQVNAGL